LGLAANEHAPERHHDKQPDAEARDREERLVTVVAVDRNNAVERRGFEGEGRDDCG